jgi:hypothetical protein
MFEWMSKRGKDAWKFLVWFYIFTYVPVIPAYYLMAFKGWLGFVALIYVAFSISIILIFYLKNENQKIIRKSVNTN